MTNAADDPAARAIAWLATQQRDDGSFANVSAKNVVETLAAAGIDPAAWPTTQKNALLQMDREASLTSDVPRPLHAASVAGYERPALVASLRASYHNGTFGTKASPPWDAFCILALRAAGTPPTDAALQATAQHLLAGRSPQGGWPTTYSPTAAADTDTTGFVLAALTSVGMDVRGDSLALVFLNATHATGGGHAGKITLGGGANTQSTVWALHAYRLLGAAPPADDESWLMAQQQNDGAFLQSPGSTKSTWATAEAALYLSGGRYPLPGIVPPMLSAPHALEPATLALPPEYVAARWAFPDGSTAEGARVTHTFPAAGSVTLQLDARGERAIHRGPMALSVLSARPVVIAPPDVNALRRIATDIDITGSYDPDGAITAWRVAWGDGTTSSVTTHTYSLPGDFTVTLLAQDDAGEWSSPARVLVHVADRAPVLSGLPTRVETDRISNVHLAPDASDPDGDALRVSWTSGDLSGNDAADLRFTTLGEHDVRFVAADAFGLTATALVRVDVKNLLPSLAGLTLPRDARDGDIIHLAVNVSDADGPVPTVTWQIDDTTLQGMRVEASLAAGDHRVAVIAQDADGGMANLTATLTVLARAAPTPPVTQSGAEQTSSPPPAPPAPARPPPDPPAISLAQRITAGEPTHVRVTLPEDASVALDFGDGSTGEGTDAAHTWERPGDYELRATASTADGSTSTATVLVHVAARLVAKPTTTPLALQPANVTVTPSEEARSPTSGPQALQSPTRETPESWPLALGGLLLAAVGMRRRRGGR